MSAVFREPRLINAFSLLAFLAAGSAMDGATLDVNYTADVLYNVDGGIESGTTYLEDIGLTFSAGVSPSFGADSAKLFVYLLHNNSATFSDRYVGDLQVVSNIDTGRGTRIYELWYEQSWYDRYSLRFGLYDLNSEFDSIETAGLFMNSSHGIGAEFGQSGIAGPSIFPSTSLAARFDWRINASSTLRFALLDGVPGDPNDSSKTAIRLGGGDGVLTAFEFDYRFSDDTRFAIGGWLYSEEFDLLDGDDGQGNPLRDDGNGGVYAFVDATLLRSNNVTLDGYLRFGFANDDINVLGSYVGAGLVASGLLQLRPEDQFGLALARAKTGGTYRRVTAASGNPAYDAETNIELTYSAQINNWLRLQPNAQFVVDPGANRALDDAFVVGLRFELTASF